MEIRLDRHGRHVAIVTIDNQPRLNAMTRRDAGRARAGCGTSWSAMPAAASS